MSTRKTTTRIWDSGDRWNFHRKVRKSPDWHSTNRYTSSKNLLIGMLRE